jgi:hypothetical protein
VIEQAKGMLSLLYGIDAEAAFALLRWRSQESNVKLRALAQRVVADFRNVRGLDPGGRSVYDELFVTAHQRVTDSE